RKPPKADGVARLQVKIIFGQIDTAAAFSDKRFIVPQTAARLIQLCTRQAGQPDAWESGFVHAAQELLEVMQYLAAQRKERVDGYVDCLRAAEAGHGSSLIIVREVFPYADLRATCSRCGRVDTTKFARRGGRAKLAS